MKTEGLVPATVACVRVFGVSCGYHSQGGDVAQGCGTGLGVCVCGHERQWHGPAQCAPPGMGSCCHCVAFRLRPASSAPLPGEVALAFCTDNCGRCHRVIDVNEPIYGVNGGGIWCAACNDAVPRAVPLPGCDRCGAGPGVECNAAAHDSHADAPLPSRFTDAATSFLLRRAATAIGALGVAAGYAATADEGLLIVELRARAVLLEDAAATADTAHRNHCEKWSGPWDLLRAIGEVRS